MCRCVLLRDAEACLAAVLLALVEKRALDATGGVVIALFARGRAAICGDSLFLHRYRALSPVMYAYSLCWYYRPTASSSLSYFLFFSVLSPAHGSSLHIYVHVHVVLVFMLDPSP